MKKKFWYKIIGLIAITTVVGGLLFWQQGLLPWSLTKNADDIDVIFPPKDGAGNPISGVFEATTPCDTNPKPLPQIPNDAPCDQLVWKLALYKSSKAQEASTYTLSGRYGLSQPNTPNQHIGGGTMIEIAGNWTVAHGTADKRDAELYHLNTEAGTISLIKVSDNILHLLDQENRLRVGNGAWSYSLHKTDTLLPLASKFTSYQEKPVAGAESGVFVGRTPCYPIAEQLNIPMPNDCSRIKWEVTLYQDSQTLTPTTYRIRRVDVPDDTTDFIEGSWKKLSHSSSMTIYQLDLKEYGTTLSFAKGDNNILFFLDEDMNLRVGNNLLSYTLSRKTD